MVKTGIGYDVHSLKKGESLLLGGVTISSSIGVIAHSDGDVLLHAMVDALLGAAALGDLGKFFPSSCSCHQNEIITTLTLCHLFEIWETLPPFLRML